MYLNLHGLQLFLKAASCLLILFLLLQQVVLIRLQLADLAAQVQLLTRLLLPQLLRAKTTIRNDGQKTNEKQLHQF